MITVKYNTGKEEPVECLLKDIAFSEPFSEHKFLPYSQRIIDRFGDTPITTFIGKCGFGPSGKLYLVSCNSIILLEEPERMWCSPTCSVIIEEVVDIEIKV